MRPSPPPPGGRRVDLHSHSIFSDGTLTPEGLVARAVERHLAALALTDHDTLEGVARARTAAGGALELVPGIELSSAFDGVDLHVLGYYLNPEGTAAEFVDGAWRSGDLGCRCRRWARCCAVR